MLPELLAFLERSKVSIDTEYWWSNLKKAFELTEVGLASDTDTVVKLKADAGDKLDGSKVDTDSLRSLMDNTLVIVHHPHGTATYSEGSPAHAALSDTCTHNDCVTSPDRLPDVKLGEELFENLDLDTKLVSNLLAEAGESVSVDVINMLRVSHVIVKGLKQRAKANGKKYNLCRRLGNLYAQAVISEGGTAEQASVLKMQAHHADADAEMTLRYSLTMLKALAEKLQQPQ